MQHPTGVDKSPFMFAHEFFDALPIHAFQSIVPSPADASPTIMTPTGSIKSHKAVRSEGPEWRELLVSSKPRFNAQTPTEDEFQLSLAKASTPSSLVMPEFSSRYKTLRARPGSTIEISPEGLGCIQEIARRIGGPNPKKGTLSSRPPSGAALIIDYGTSATIPINSLRGIRNHRQVSPFSAPGLVDISADVDFTALAEAALKASPGIEVYGPVEQGDFLQMLGIAERAEQLLRVTPGPAKKEILQTATKRLVERSGGGMGRIYKAMAIVPESGGTRRPVGFGGSVVL
jgi:NADH dehydrogenase [ubiquinone] 1 alpha subcomplex assembly factor 7